MSGPLSGIRSIEVGHMLAGPYCGLLLADMGAEVIKIEPPEGDIARTVSPHFIGPHNAYFASLNRNKKSVVIDLVSDVGRTQLKELVADVIAQLRALNAGDVKVFVGGTIPGSDQEVLRELGVSAVFTADMSLDEVVAELAHKLS